MTEEIGQVYAKLALAIPEQKLVETPATTISTADAVETADHRLDKQLI